MKQQWNMAFLMALLTGCGMNPVASLGGVNGGFGADAIHSLPYKSIEMNDKHGAVEADGVSDGIILLAATGKEDTKSSFAFSMDNGASGTKQAYPALPAQNADGAKARAKRIMDSRLQANNQYALRMVQSGALRRYRTMAVSAPQAIEKFYVSDSESNKTEQISAKLIKTSKNAYFFVDDRDLSMVDMSNVDEFANYWDNKAYPTNNATFGGACKAPYDIDGDNHVYFVFSHLLHDGVCGYFKPYDQIADVDKSQPGNPHKMLYLGSWMAKKGSNATDLVNATLIHEYQHLLNFYHKVRVPALQGKQIKGTEALWLNEALSVFSEQLGGYGLPAGEECAVNYCSSFLEKNPNAPLVTEDYKNFEYGEAYLFMIYLVDRFGKDVPSKLVASEDLGIENVEHVTGQKFEDLFRDWVMALYASGKETGYGFDMIDLSKTYGGHKFSGMKAIEATKFPGQCSLNVANWSPVLVHLTPKAKTHLRVAVTAAGPFTGALFTK